MPKRPTSGKAKPDITFCEGKDGRVLRDHSAVSLGLHRVLQGRIVMRGDFRVSALLLLSSSDTTCIRLPRNRMSGILHVRICGGAGR